ncbi:Spy/CpxP family protein refolding chaperone [Hydrogenophaga sp. OTU3427]|jgi:periplasmic protein CpxP/Spy|uniref:Spy/CpxP family protein refolding chaperone n=1 Tax=Hydrogenophaga sp. OTU3427 TaxID=3043856 RepID=UPI00313AE141
MKPWIKKTLFTAFGATLVLGGLSACGSRDHHGRGWSDERVTEMRGKAIERISGKLDLNTAQQQKLAVLADELIAQRQAWRGQGADPRTQFKGLIAQDKFDRAGAQALLDQKAQLVQGAGPKVIAALADFYDSLNPEQQKQVREKLDKRHGWGRG